MKTIETELKKLREIEAAAEMAFGLLYMSEIEGTRHDIVNVLAKVLDNAARRRGMKAAKKILAEAQNA